MVHNQYAKSIPQPLIWTLSWSFCFQRKYHQTQRNKFKPNHLKTKQKEEHKHKGGEKKKKNNRMA